MDLNDVDENDVDVDNPLEYLKNQDKPLPGISRKRVETIDLNKSEAPVVKRRRGRPPSKVKPTTDIEKMVADGLAYGFGFVLTVFAVRIAKNNKYKMTREEAVSAATATTTVLFQYQQIRELATSINQNGNAYIIFKGFYPYFGRVIIKEMMENVFSGLFVSRGGGGNKSPNPGDNGKYESIPTVPQQFNSNPIVGQSQSHHGEPIIPEINGLTDWRDI